MTSTQPIVLGYVRVSTSEQRKGWSLGMQEQEIREACTREGWTLAEIYRDEGRSGAQATTRPGLMACLRRLASGGYSALVVAKEDRLARSVADATDIRAHAFRHGTAIAIVEPWSVERPQAQRPDDIEGSLRQLAQILAEEELQRMRQRILPGVTKAARAGRRGGHTPLGYRRLGAETFAVDPFLGPRITQAFADLRAGSSLYQVHGFLAVAPSEAEQALLAGMEPPTIGIDQVRYLLRNRFYLGELSYAVPPGQRAHAGERIVLAQHHPALTDPMTFAEVQTRLDELRTRARAKHRRSESLADSDAVVPAPSRTPLTILEALQQGPKRRCSQGILPPEIATCASCGERLYCARQTAGPPGHRHDRYYYKCTRRHRLGPTACPERPAPRDAVEEPFLRSFFAHLGRLPAPTLRSVVVGSPRAAEREAERAKLQARIDRLTVLDNQDAQVLQRLERLRADLHALDEESKQTLASGAPVESLRERLRADPVATWATLTHPERIDAVRSFTRQVWIGQRQWQRSAWLPLPDGKAEGEGHQP